MTSPTPKDRSPLLAALAIALAVAFVYAPAASFPFISMDDAELVYRNPPVLQGLSWEGLRWAFTTFHWGTWQPLSWLSHMADVSLFGTDAGMHHLVNVLLHLANALLLLWALRALTGFLWRSALVAVLFAVHPLHVESVAWVAERKDVLSTLFLFLALRGYGWYAEAPSRGRLLAAVALPYAASLLSKPMGVTFPFLLLLLDGWPLSRFGEEGVTARGVARLLPEKAPLFLLSAASAAVTLASGWGAAAAAANPPLSQRLAGAAASYGAYLADAAWPSSLSVIHPHPWFLGRPVPPWQWGGALVLLAALSAAAWRLRRHRFVAVGWLWYLGTLVPVIGFVLPGIHARADRYTYVPLVGIFLAVAWGVPAALGERMREKGVRTALAVAAAAWLLALAAAARHQAGYWRDTATLFRHAVDATGTNPQAWYRIGLDHLDHGRREEAAEACRTGIRSAAPPCPFPWDGPGGNGEGWYQLGNVLAEQRRLAEAEGAYREAVRRAPANPLGWYGLGTVAALRGDRERFREALREARALDAGVAEELLRAFPEGGGGGATPAPADRGAAPGGGR